MEGPRKPGSNPYGTQPSRKRGNERGQHDDGAPQARYLRTTGPHGLRRTDTGVLNRRVTESTPVELHSDTSEPFGVSQADALERAKWPLPTSINDIGSTQQQITNVCTGRQRAGVVPVANFTPEQLELLRTTSVLKKRRVICDSSGDVIVFWREGSQVSERAVSDYCERVRLIREWSTKLRLLDVQGGDITVRETMRDCLMYDAHVALVDGDDSFKLALKSAKDKFLKANLPHIVGKELAKVKAWEDYLNGRACARVHRRFLNYETPVQFRKKMLLHLEDDHYWHPRDTKQRKDYLLSEIINPVIFGANDESRCITNLITALQEQQQKTLSDNPVKNAEDAKRMINKIDSLEKAVFEACQVATGIKKPREVGYLRTLYSWLRVPKDSNAKVEGDVYKLGGFLDESSGDTRTRTQTLNRLIKWVQGERELTLQVAADPGAALCGGRVSWNEAIEFKRCGYTLDPLFTVCSTLNDKNLDDKKLNFKDGVILGEGAFHQAVQLEHVKDGKQFSRVFKGISALDRTGWNTVVGQELFMDRESPRLIARNKAVCDIAWVLNMEKVVPGGEFTTHKKQFGLQMEVAPGVTGNKLVKLGSQSFTRYFDEYKKNREFCSNIIKQLNQLEWLDALCANIDRNGGNIMFDSSGRVTGIDNDTCLYPFSDIIKPCVDSDPEKQKEVRGGCKIGFPLVIDKSTLAALKDLDIKDLRYQLRQKLTLNELDALEVRYSMLIEHARGLENNGMVVSDWKTWTHPDNGMNIHEFFMSTQIVGETDVEEANCRSRLAAPHKQKEDDLLFRVGSESNMTADQHDTYQMHKNLAKTMSVGVNTSYTAMYFGKRAARG